jgi:hypothetical protein
MVDGMTTTDRSTGGYSIPAAERPACWWALLVGAPPRGV